jgi:hypothetical protein
MEELQDAIEDAQYMSALNDIEPQPTRDWDWPSKEELNKYLSQLEEKSPNALDIEFICRGSLGFYLVYKLFLNLIFIVNNCFFIICFCWKSSQSLFPTMATIYWLNFYKILP